VVVIVVKSVIYDCCKFFDCEFVIEEMRKERKGEYVIVKKNLILVNLCELCFFICD
jgi:hypothetical protein